MSNLFVRKELLEVALIRIRKKHPLLMAERDLLKEKLNKIAATIFYYELGRSQLELDDVDNDEYIIMIEESEGIQEDLGILDTKLGLITE